MSEVDQAAAAKAAEKKSLQPQKTYYSIVSPGTLRPNSEYHVAISVHKSDEPTTIEVSLNGPSFSVSKTVELKPFSIEFIKFDIPSIENGKYNLTAKGLKGHIFEDKIDLNFQSNKYVVMIQTDKATYKPGDLVRYRVFILDRGLRPTKIPGSVNIRIEDKNDNIIKQHKDVKLTSGVYTGELQLSTFPVLGNWVINVDADSDTERKYFEVAEYVLPKFETTIESPNHVLFDDGKIHVNVVAKYTYGKPVKGEAVVTLVPKNDPDFKKIIPFDGKALVEIDLNKDFKMEDRRWQRTITVEAIVEEKLTGIKRKATKDISIHVDKYNIQSVDFPPHYKANELFDICIKITKYDGTPVHDTQNPIILTVTNDDDEKNFIKLEQSSDKNGIATFNLAIPDSKKSFNVKAKYKNAQSYIGYLYQASEVEPRADFHIQQKTENAKIDEDLVFEVNSPENMKYFVYQIVTRGDILETKLIEVPDKKNHTFKIQPTYLMSPNADLFVYRVKEDGELVFDETSIYFSDKLGNFVHIDIQEQAKPGDEIDIKIKAKPNSYVGLLGVDQSVLLLKSGNDIKKCDALDKVKNFKSNTPYIKGYGRYPGRTSGVITLTNAHYPWELVEKICRKKCVGMRLESICDEMPLSLCNKNFKRYCHESSRSPPVIVERKEFPETWIWATLKNINTDGTAVIRNKVPDTITSWVLTGFSIDPIYGLGLTEDPQTLKVFQPFFISTNLPYSVKRGEVIGIPISVFNYLEKSLDSEIILDNKDQEFEFTEPQDTEDQIQRTKKVSVASNSGEAVSFMIRPKKTGSIKIKITARTPIAGDAIEQMLLVEPEGVTEYINKAIFIDLRQNTEFQENIKIEIPENAVPDSTHIEVSVVSDILGPTIKNLDQLVRKPYGCGEQNMVNFVPNILVLKYLESISQLTPEIESKAKKFLEIGYQRQLTYKHKDGSYSAFGESDISGSTWLTAYVARSFRQATEYTLIDEEVIISALNFLVSKQAKDGSFPEVGRLFDKHEGGSEGLSLTAFTVLAFLENDKTIPNYKENISKALDYIAKNIETEDLYALALSAYVLQIAKHSAADSTIEKLEGRATKDGDKKYWNKPIAKPKKGEWCCYGPKSVDVEMTSYTLLALLETDQAANSLPIVKWLISQRNSNGGFSSTQDTVVGLQALTKFAQNLSAKDCNIDINVKDGEEVKGKLTVNKDNAIVLQSYELPSTLKEVSVVAKGKGVALAQVSYRYNINNNQPKPSFAVNAKLDNISNSDYLKLLICTSFVPGEGGAKESNMALIEVSLPSGFTIENEAIKSLQKMKGVKKVETKKGDSVVVLYFDSLGTKTVCPVVEAYKTHKVDELKPSAIIVYDYYDNSRQARVFYDAP